MPLSSSTLQRSKNIIAQKGQKGVNVMNTFTVVETKLTVEEVTIDTYGIERDAIRIENISINKTAVEEFVAKLNAVGDVDNCHIMDLVEDEFFC